MTGERPSLATQPFSPRCCTCIFFLSSPPSPAFCLLPALLVLFSCSMCLPLVVSAPWLYLARPHAPLGFCPVFRPVSRLGRPQQTPLRGNSPVVLSRRPPLHQFPDGRAGWPVQLNARHRHGASLWESLCSLVPLLAPCSPHLPRPASSMCPSCVSACSALVVFFFFVFALPAAPARPACAPCSSPCYPCPAALRPLSRLSPLPFSFSLSTLPVRLPSLSEPRCYSCEPPACSTPVPPPSPYPFPWGLPLPSAPSVPVSHPVLVALSPVCGGGGVSAD